VIISRGYPETKNSACSDRQIVNKEGAAAHYYHWDGKEVSGEWPSALEDADLVINLAGRTVNCRYNQANKKQIVESRVQSTAAIGKAIRKCHHPPKLWINAASATIYRHAEDQPQDEYSSNFHNDFSVQVCKQWEAEFWGQSTHKTRKVCLRIAISLGNGGIMKPYLKMVRWGLGGRQANGKQRFSWIHVTDLCRIMQWVLDHPDMDGVYNAAAPRPTNNENLMRILRRSQKRRFGLPAPRCLLRMGALLIGTETELLLKSRWVLPTRVLDSGFQFMFPDLASAVEELTK